jgi:(p)ppGpp synthase/HD superfamily hydrolase
MPNFENKKTILDNAQRFAVEAHESINQKRKYSGEPYYIHCRRVVEILCEVTTDEEMLAAAWMHDVLEDVTPHRPEYLEAKIRELCGDRVCQMVLELTDSKLEFGNRAVRKAHDRKRLASASNETKTIKLADIIDNFTDIHKSDAGFAIVFTREIELLLPYLSGGNPLLFRRLSSLLMDYRKLRRR